MRVINRPGSVGASAGARMGLHWKEGARRAEWFMSIVYWVGAINATAVKAYEHRFSTDSWGGVSIAVDWDQVAHYVGVGVGEWGTIYLFIWGLLRGLWWVAGGLTDGKSARPAP